MSRATTAFIDLSALRHNLQRVRDAAPGRRIAAAVKANAYGHGLLRVARALEGADALAVACIEEAVGLREGGIKKPILLLEGVFEASELPLCSQLNLEIVVHHLSQLEMLEHARLEHPLKVWLKIDTGMHRLGVAPDQVLEIWQRLDACPMVAPGIRLMSHLANADDRGDDFTLQQLHVLREVTSKLSGERSLANSAGILGWPQTHFDWVRPGLMLYGATPFIEAVGSREELRPVMTLSTRLISVKRLRKGEPVGYSCTWICPEDMDLGIAAIGYGDGYPRHTPSGTPVLVNGREASIVGRVSMDMLCIDLRRHPEARVEDPVVLWGEGLPIEVIARAASTIPYTLMCTVTSRVYFKERDGDGR
jgi:alanine racemase